MKVNNLEKLKKSINCSLIIISSMGLMACGSVELSKEESSDAAEVEVYELPAEVNDETSRLIDEDLPALEDGVLSLEEWSEIHGQRFEEADADQDGMLTVEEARQGHLKHRISHRDTDGDGEISLDEWLEAARERFEKRDDDGDGIVTQEEVMSKFMKKRGIRGKFKEMHKDFHPDKEAVEAPDALEDDTEVVEAPEEGTEVVEEDKARHRGEGFKKGFKKGMKHRGKGFHKHPKFEEVDADGNGEITLEEVEAFATEKFNEKDADGSGSITVDEIQVADAGEEFDFPPHFKKIDTDEDEQISREEWDAMAEKLFSHLDANEDGELDEEERAHRKGPRF